ncbi:hypothetical protein [Comamonas sp. GB3 AK4-5]|uniref:hypothetical protein n=1 Tax=Comamonas sp. GB3 AK4-5 TaxID=3231487 RepID=UPI00351E831D
MKHFGLRTLQTTVGAVALSMAGWALAQSSDTPAAPASPPAADAQVAPMHQPPHAQPRHNKPRHAQPRRADHRQHMGNPQAREAAAARQAERQGQLGGPQSANQYERNAMARCQVFKADTDRHSCEQRMRHGHVSGSVEGGGMLMEYTEQVPVSQ